MNRKSVPLVVVGGGSAGLSAAISAFDNGIKDILIIERLDELGGILNQCIHSGFGLKTFNEDMTGPEFAHTLIEKAKERGINYLLSTSVLSISKNKEVVTTSKENGVVIYEAKAIIFALGCNERSAGQIFLSGSRPNGIFTAGLAQKYLNIDGYLVGKKVYILGSGDIGLIMARRMTLEGAKVIGVSEIMPYSNGLQRNIVQCLEDYDIPLRLSNTVVKTYGKHQLTGIDICDVDENLKPILSTVQHIECDTLLLSVGLYPFNAMLKNAGAKVYPGTKGSYVDQNLETTIEGIFSTGNVLHVHDLVDDVFIESKIAGKNASDYLLNKRGKKLSEIPVSFKGNISYLLPNVISVYEHNEPFKISFRVKKPCKKGIIFIKSGETLLQKLVKVDLLPANMVFIDFKETNFENIDKIEVELKEEV